LILAGWVGSLLALLHNRGMIAGSLARLPGKPKLIYICGSNPFVENAAQHADGRRASRPT